MIFIYFLSFISFVLNAGDWDFCFNLVKMGWEAGFDRVTTTLYLVFYYCGHCYYCGH